MLLGLTTAASATDAAIHKKMFGSLVTTLVISNEEMNNIMKLAKRLKMKQKNKTEDFSECY